MGGTIRIWILQFDAYFYFDWTYSNGYYYYNYKLSPNETTSSLIKSVTFNPNTKLDDTCVSTQTATGQTITCNSSGSDYDNATYTLTFNVETVQYNKYQEAWSTDVAIAEEKQRMLKGLKVNVTDATFENGDKTAMFEFSHPATAQTPALTDYRYIGHMPNNYVKFNCDNDGTNCEIWRIIGVFSVDDGDGNWEQRIKLVRGSALPERMQWDSNNVNEWSTASLNLFLNGDYLTRDGDASTYGLKESAQSQIEEAKYYLGELPNSNDFHNYPNYRSTESEYNWERGTERRFDDLVRTTNWIGKIGLIYPSDYGFTFSKGVEDDCYNDLMECYVKEATPSDEAIIHYPDASWIYNSNNNYWIWGIYDDPEEPDNVWYIDSNGGIECFKYNVNEYGGVRPVVYLKSSINITGGEGTEQNPYVLSY